MIGAGPYGLSVAAHLRARNADFRVFGTPLETWRTRMPRGMELKSDGFASSLSAPVGGATLGDWCREHGQPYHDTDIPVPLETFVAYGLDFQRRYVPDLEPGFAVSIAEGGRGYRVEMADGDAFEARRVVLAVGITHYDSTPEVFAGLGPERLSHACAHHDLSGFRGRDVTVIGAGSSAVDIAVGLAEAGAHARLIGRRTTVKFGSRPSGRPRGPWARLRHPASGLGPGLRSRLCCDAPDLFRLLPGDARLEIVRRHLGPSSPWRLRDRFEAGVEVRTGRRIDAAADTGGRVRLDLTGPEGPEAVETEHVICATGYRADIARLGFLDPALRAGLRTVGGAPVLNGGFESSAPGLHFVGVSAAATFGPLMRFMFGDDFAARRIVRRLQATAA